MQPFYVPNLKMKAKNTSVILCSVWYYSSIRSLSGHISNWFLSPLALQETGMLHTTWRYSDRIVELYQSPIITINPQKA